MSVVYRARDDTLQRDVAVKVMHRHLARDPEARKRFSREARAVARLTHPNIPEIYDFSSTQDDVSFIVVELIDGPSLAALLSEGPPLLPELGVMACLGVARALSHAHAAGIVHRDVKPENILIGRDGIVRLTDFGIAQIVGLESMTMTGTLIGSPAHMAPEQIDGTRDLDLRVDVWALGTVLYMASTGGALPFEADNPHSVLKKIVDGDYVSPRHINPHVDSALDGIISRCLQVDRDARYPSMAALIEELVAWLAVRGLTDPAREIRLLLADPEGHSRRFSERLTRTMMALADEALAHRERHLALERYGRALTLDPDHPEAAERLRALSSGLRTRKLVMRSALALLTAGAVASVSLLALRPGPTPPTRAVALGPGAIPPAPPNLEPAPRPDATSPAPEVHPGALAGALLGDALATAAAARPARVRAAAALRRAPAGRRPSAASRDPVDVRLTAFPPAVRITVAGKTLPAGSTVALRPGTYRVELHHPLCPDCPANRHSLVVKPNPAMYIEKNYTFRYAPATLELRCAEGRYAMDGRGKRYACNKTYQISVSSPRPQTMTLSLHDASGALVKSQNVLLRQSQGVVLKL